MTAKDDGFSHPCAGCGHWLAPWVAACSGCGRPQPGVPTPESAPANADEAPASATSFFDAPAAQSPDGNAVPVVSSEPAAPESPSPSTDVDAAERDAPLPLAAAASTGPTSASEAAVRALSKDRVYCPFCAKHIPTTADRCPRCPPAAAAGPHGRTSRCPRCAAALVGACRDAVPADVCERCGGMWLDRENVARALPLVTHGTGRPSGPLPRRENRDAIEYLPCPRCGVRMARRLFAPRSDVIVDLCLEHGLWLDRAEFDHLLAFLSAGGLEIARARDDARERGGRMPNSSTPWLDIDSSGGIGKETLRALDRATRANLADPLWRVARPD